MSTNVMSPETASRIKQWATRTGKSEDELKAKYWELYNSAKTKNPDMDPKLLDARSRATTYALLRGELSTRAQPAIGILIAADAPRNIGDIQRRQILAMDKAKALSLGLLNPAGIPLDIRKDVGGRVNPNFGKPIQDIWLRNCYGVFAPIVESKQWTAKVTRITLSRDIARAPVLLGVPLKTRLNFQDLDPNATSFRANGSTSTRWEPTGETTNVHDMIDKFFGAYYIPLADLAVYHEKNKTDKVRFVVTEGNVATVNRTPMRHPAGRETDPDIYFMMISDEADTFDTQPTSIFVPEHLLPQLDFGPSSRVTVMGRSRLVPGYDRELRKPLPDQPRVALDAWSVYCRPEFRVEAPSGVNVS